MLQNYTMSCSHHTSLSFTHETCVLGYKTKTSQIPRSVPGSRSHWPGPTPIQRFSTSSGLPCEILCASFQPSRPLSTFCSVAFVWWAVVFGIPPSAVATFQHAQCLLHKKSSSKVSFPLCKVHLIHLVTRPTRTTATFADQESP